MAWPRYKAVISCILTVMLTCFTPIQAAYAASVHITNHEPVTMRTKNPGSKNKRSAISRAKTKTNQESGQENRAGQTLKVSADAAVLMDVSTGQVLYDKNGHKSRAPASTTKIMTAILGLELAKPNEIVTVSEKAASVGEATLHLDPGEKIALFELITGALLRSGNDACVAIAEHVAGTEEEFVRLMNRKAWLLGAHNTHFENTNGLPQKGHFSTAYDLALMARYGLQLPAFASITRQKETEVHFLEPNVMMEVKNTNKLLWSYPYADGVKTGTTNAAGKCLVASATKDGRQLVAVVLHAPDRFGDAKKLLEWGFESTEKIRYAEAGTVMGKFSVQGKTVNAFLAEPLDFCLNKQDKARLKGRIIWEREAKLPIAAGEKLGRYEVWVGDKRLTSADLLSKSSIAVERSPKNMIKF